VRARFSLGLHVERTQALYSTILTPGPADATRD